MDPVYTKSVGNLTPRPFWPLTSINPWKSGKYYWSASFSTTTPLLCEILAWLRCMVANSSPSWRSARHRSSSAPRSLCSVKQLFELRFIHLLAWIFFNDFISFHTLAHCQWGILTDLLLQSALQRVHLHLLLPQTGLVGRLLLLGLGSHLSYVCIGPENTQVII